MLPKNKTTKIKRIAKPRRYYMVDYVNSIHFGHYYYNIDSITQTKQLHISVMELGATVDVTAKRRTCACTGIRTWFALVRINFSRDVIGCRLSISSCDYMKKGPTR